MKKHKMRILPLLLVALLVVMMTAPTAGIAAGQPTVGLGSTSTYAVLAGSGITNTGPTIINGDAGGDVGSDPTGTFTGQDQATISGAVHLADAASLLAKTDLITAYDDAAGRIPVATIPSELGGQTLIPGTYDSVDGTFQITGTLTLDAQGDPDGVFVFKTASTLTTATDSNISLLNGARYCRTFWQVGISATLGTNSHFVGHIFALTSITANTGASVQGQLLARNGAVTLDTNTIMNGICADTPAPPAPTTPATGGGGSSGGSDRDRTDAPTPQVPQIFVTKAADPIALSSNSGDVIYTYRITNPGNIPLSNISIVDNKIPTLTYVSGDMNNDSLLQTEEAWVYTGRMFLTETTSNTVTAKGTGNGTTVQSIAEVTVPVSIPVAILPVEVVPLDAVPLEIVPTPVNVTITGGELPKTSGPWFNLLLAGAALTTIGIAGWRRKQ